MIRVRMAVLAVLLAGLVPLAAGGTQPGPGPAGPAIRAMLGGSAAAWNRGDLGAFMQSYEQSPDTTYVSAKTVIHGFANIRAHYAAGYKAAMGTLSISDIAIRPLGATYAVVVARWHLSGAGGSRTTGLFTLVLHRTPAGWKIITDHSP